MAITDVLKVNEYKAQLEQRQLELNKLTEQRTEIEKSFTEAIEEKNQQLQIQSQQTAELENQIQTYEAKTQELQVKTQELERELVTNFEGLVNEINQVIYPTAYNVMQISTVESCINLIANSIAQMPVYLYEYDKENNRIEIENDNRVKLLNKQPNKYMNAYTFKKNMLSDYLLHGAGYAAIEKSEYDFGFEIDELHYLPRESVTVTPLKQGYKPAGGKFKITTTTGEGIQKQSSIDTLTEQYVLRLLNKTNDGVTGVGILETARDLLERALQEDRYLLKIYQNGAMIRGVLQTKNRLSQANIDRLRQSFKSIYSGTHNSNLSMVLEEGLEYKPITMSPADLQFNEFKKATVSEICRVLNVPESLISTDANKYGTISENNLHFVKYCLGPIIKAFEQALNQSFLDDEERERMEFKFDVEELERATEAERYKSLIEATGGPILTLNEAREKIDLPNVEGGNDMKHSLGHVLQDTETGEMTVPNMDGGTDKNKEDVSHDETDNS